MQQLMHNPQKDASAAIEEFCAQLITTLEEASVQLCKPKPTDTVSPAGDGCAQKVNGNSASWSEPNAQLMSALLKAVLTCVEQAISANT